MPLEQIDAIEVQYQAPEEIPMQNIDFAPTNHQIIQTSDVPVIQSNIELPPPPSYEVHTLQDISYSSGLHQNTTTDNEILQPNISFAFWSASSFDSGATTQMQM